MFFLSYRIKLLGGLPSCPLLLLLLLATCKPTWAGYNAANEATFISKYQDQLTEQQVRDYWLKGCWAIFKRDHPLCEECCWAKYGVKPLHALPTLPPPPAEDEASSSSARTLAPMPDCSCGDSTLPEESAQ